MSICRECTLENAQKFYNQHRYSYDIIKSCTLNDQGQHHSFYDEPSIVHEDSGVSMWHKNGKLHRENGPASIRYSRDYYYYEDHSITTLESLYVGKTCEWGESMALIVEKINDTFYKIMVGDRKFLVASVCKI